MTTGADGIDPMTMLMMQRLMAPQAGGQQYGMAMPQGGGGGAPQQAAPTGAMTGLNNALAPIQQALMIRALKQKLQNQQPPTPEPTGYPTQQPPSAWTQEQE
jgi:hypothetical protein